MPPGEGDPDPTRARVVAGLLAVHGSERFPTEVCRILHGELDCVRVSLGQLDWRRSRIRGAYWPPLPRPRERTMLKTFARYGVQHPRVQARLRGRRLEGVVSWHDLPQIERFWDTALYQRFYADDQITDQLSFSLSAPAGLAIGVTLDRAGGRFDDHQRAVVEAVLPELGHAFSGAGRDWLESSLRQLGWASITIEPDGVVLRHCALAPAVGRQIGVDLRTGQTVARAGWWPGVVRALQPLDRMQGSLVPRPVTVVGGQAHVIVEVPLVGHPRLHIAPGPRGAATPGADLLTTRQREVAVLLVEGLTTPQIAQRLGCSRPTVRSHVEQIYARLGVHTRAAAVSRLLGPMP